MLFMVFFSSFVQRRCDFFSSSPSLVGVAKQKKRKKIAFDRVKIVDIVVTSAALFFTQNARIKNLERYM